MSDSPPFHPSPNPQFPIPNSQSPLRPTSPDDLAALVRQAAATNTQLRITGTNSLPLTTFDPTRPLQTLSTLRMNKVLRHAVSDMTISVHAGISLENLQRALAWHNQWLPVDPPIITPPALTPAVFNGAGPPRSPAPQTALSTTNPPQAPIPNSHLRPSKNLASAMDNPIFDPTKADDFVQEGVIRRSHFPFPISPGSRTLGGIIASNSLGPLRFGLAGGDWRRLILGIRWIDATGTLVKGGGQTVKNVAGYSSTRMLIGSAGSLGIIAEITLRTFARPADEQSLFFFTRNPAHAEELLAAILTSPTTPDYLELVAPRTFAANPLQLPGADGSGPVLVAGFLGRPETCAAQIAILRALPAAAHTESISQTAAQSGRFRLWITSEPALPAPATPNTAVAGIGFRLHVTSSQTAALLAALEAQVPNAWLVAEAQGVLRGILPTPNPLPLLRQLAPHSPLLITQGTAPPTPSHPLVTRLKHALDPQTTFGNAPT